MKTKLLILSSILLCVLVLFGCKPKQEVQNVDFKLHSPSMYLAENSTELKSPLGISFYASVAPINYTEQDLSANITITPALKGKWSWQNDDYLNFQPEENWALNTKYKITFGPELFSKNVKVSSTSTSFSTMDY